MKLERIGGLAPTGQKIIKRPNAVGFTVMFAEVPIIHIDWLRDNESDIQTQRLTKWVPDFVSLALENNDHPTVEDVNRVFRLRAVPEYRVDIKDILREFKLPCYSAPALCRATHGRTGPDRIWFKYDDEDITYEELTGGEE